MTLIIIIIITTKIIVTVEAVIESFPAHDELGAGRISLVSPEQPVLGIPVSLFI